MDKYDVVVIGGGPGGYVAALRAGIAGLKTALIEKDRVGGTCLNRGCIPTKALIASALASYRAGHASAVGLEDTLLAFSDEGAFAHSKKTVETLVKGVEALLNKRSVTVLPGLGSINGPGAVSVKSSEGESAVEAENVIIATGSVPFFPAGLEPDGKVVLGSDEILEQNAPPTPVGKSVAVIGGGIIGVELACFYAMTGRQVTVIEMLDRLLPVATPAASKELTRAFKKMRIKVKTGSRVEEVARQKDGAAVTLNDGSSVEVETVVSAVGRRPCLDGIGIDALGAKQHKDGRIAVGEHGRITDGVYAIGDAAGEQPMLAHAASHQGISAVHDIIGVAPDGKPEPVASVVYSHPEVAWVGEVPVSAEPGELKEAAFPFRALGRAHTVAETAGYVTLYTDADGKIKGGDIVGESAGELIGIIALAIRLGAGLDDLANIPFPHPTFSEAIMEAAFVGLGTPLHTL